MSMELGGPSHDSFPRPDDPMIKPGSSLEKMAQQARADFEAITPDDIEAALASAKPGAEGRDGMLQKKLPEGTVEKIMGAPSRLGNIEALRQEFHIPNAAEQQRRLDAMADDFKRRYGVEISSPEVPPGADAKAIADERVVFMADRDDLAETRREDKLIELAEKDPAALLAIQETERGIATDWRHLRDYGIDTKKLEGDEYAVEMKRLENELPVAAKTARRWHVAKEQLARLYAGIGIESES